jgi:hypothetical protein
MTTIIFDTIFLSNNENKKILINAFFLESKIFCISIVKILLKWERKLQTVTI